MSSLIILIIGVFVSLDHHTEARRCFNCNHVATPRECEYIMECNSDEYCFTEQLVTASGNVVFNTGCKLNLHCRNERFTLIGKRSVHNTDRRATDISICLECCMNDFCNMKGCGVQDIPLGQRGPYCFNCATTQDQKVCNSVSLCDQDETCIVYSEDTLDKLHHTVIRSRCAKQSICDAVSHTYSPVTCTPNCCKTDFCNDRCGSSHSVNITPPPIQTTTTLFARTTAGRDHSTAMVNPTPKCDQSGDYILLHTWGALLCVHLVHQHRSWGHAREACKREGGDLVVLDTHDKAMLLRNELSANHKHEGYWIGARYDSGNNQFEWINKQPVGDSEAIWDSERPHSVHDNHSCIGMLRDHNYSEHILDCSYDNLRYICER